MSDDVRFCPAGHPSDDVGRCRVRGCSWADPSVNNTTKRKEGLPLQRKGNRRDKG